MNNDKYSFRLNLYLRGLFGLSRRQKRIILMGLDQMAILLAFFGAMSLRMGTLQVDVIQQFALGLTLVMGLSLALHYYLGLYKAINRSFDMYSMNGLIFASIGSMVLFVLVDYLVDSLQTPRSVPLIFLILLFGLLCLIRATIRGVYSFARTHVGKTRNIVIYGAGENGSQVASIIRGSPDYSLIAFIDDDPSLKGRVLRGRTVYSSKQLTQLTQRFGKFEVLLCIPNLRKKRLWEIVENIEMHKIKLNVLPSFEDLVFQKGKDAGAQGSIGMREIGIEDLLNREPIKPIVDIYENAIVGKVIMITGAGGSIGSEIAKQIIVNSPSIVVLLDHSETALYHLEQDLRMKFPDKYQAGDLRFVLCNVTDKLQVDEIVGRFKPNVVYHAAAYKHVPIVEANRFAGVKNNVIGTLNMAQASDKNDVERFILISTDKAVRPTNIMGASKRVAELVVQSFAKSQTKCKFSMVRFGNVLGSSGSVVPLFKQQIARGGPVTVTHPEVNRFFMTISEAAQLVIQAGFMAKGGEVYILDMGSPVKINDLARAMIHMSGHFTVKEGTAPSGQQIEIIYTGLRPGEKLYEEVLIDSNAIGTIHPKIMMANEPFIQPKLMDSYLAAIKIAIDENDLDKLDNIFQNTVEGYKLQYKSASTDLSLIQAALKSKNPDVNSIS